MLQKYIFMIKDEIVTPISLSEEHVEILLKGLVELGFYLSHIQIMATSYEESLSKYPRALTKHGLA